MNGNGLLGRFSVLTALVLTAPLIGQGPAEAADGEPLYPPGVDAAYALTSMENPDLSGPSLTFEIYSLSDPGAGPVVKSQTARVMFWNTADGTNRNIGAEVPGLPAGADQRNPSVLDVAAPGGGRDVYVVWQQWDDPVTATRDIWVWRGDRRGTADAGFPRKLIEGPSGSNQYMPDIGLARTPTGTHVVVAWVDDRDTSGVTGQIYSEDLTADTDGDGTPNFLEPAFDPVYAGDKVDPGAGVMQGQHDPSVGAKGIFWLDDRAAAGSGESDVYRANLDATVPAVSRFWNNTMDQVVVQTRATGNGAAWLGPGIAGGPYEPWVRKVGGAAGIITVLANPTSFDLAGPAFAITGGHGGNTDGDPDVFFHDRTAGQNVPVSTVGSAPGDRLKVQETPVIGLAPGGYRVVWADSRQWTNTSTTPWDSLAYELYVALVPTVAVTASRVTVQAGHEVTFAAKVSPNFSGWPVRFQVGQRHTAEHPWFLGGKLVWFDGWVTLGSKELNGTSKASWTWKPAEAGTYYVRVWFDGAKKYTDVGGRKVPHVGNASKVLKVVVR